MSTPSTRARISFDEVGEKRLRVAAAEQVGLLLFAIRRRERTHSGDNGSLIFAGDGVVQKSFPFVGVKVRGCEREKKLYFDLDEGCR
mmetsp:Transcript_8853/g.18821  ORF Transcript_8853/g.18821 Transcript_8853/m.18821 type:complete len:87 (+) Transcript_8853:22-282(+)